MNVSCVINAMGAGGAERVMAVLASGLAAAGRKVTVTTLDSAVPDFYPLPPGVGRNTAAGAGPCRWHEIGAQLTRVRGLRERLLTDKPDLVISFVDVTNILTLAALRGTGVPVVACEHINPLYHPLGAHWRLLRRLLYPEAARVVMLTEDTLEWARSLWPRWNAAAIPDPVEAPVFSGSGPRPAFFGPGRNLLAMGRLTGQKGFDILLRVFAGLAPRFPDWNLAILGEGPDRPALEKLRDDLGLAGRAALPGNFKGPHDILRQADLFAMSSRYEGFCLALAEALACGVPAVSFDCPSGPGLLLRDGVDGRLVPHLDEAAFGAALAELMSDANLRAAMGARAPEVLARFGVKSYLESWERLLGELAAEAGRRA